MNSCVTLDSLNIGESGVLREIDTDAVIKSRLHQIGMIPGTLITCVLRSSHGEIAAYDVRGAVIALRDIDSAHIFMVRVE